MDFLKTLMLYMSLTFATTMQAAPVPQVTQEPTATPYVQETAAPAPEITLPAVTAELVTSQITPTPTVPPEPTITPNKAYKKITMGQRGDEVTRLQNRLIELGYLAAGNADGAFGYKTRAAVMDFQKANGLAADGTPGDTTLTQLYENPDVKAKSDITPEPVPTAAGSTIAPPDADTPAGSTALEDASVVYNDAPLTYFTQQDGVTVSGAPKVYQLEDGRIQLSLDDVALCLEDWSLTKEGELIALEASGYVVTLLRIGDRYSCVVDGKSVALETDDVILSGGEAFATADFLQKALGAEVSWVGEENALLVHLEPKTKSAD